MEGLVDPDDPDDLDLTPDPLATGPIVPVTIEECVLLLLWRRSRSSRVDEVNSASTREECLLDAEWLDCALLRAVMDDGTKVGGDEDLLLLFPFPLDEDLSIKSNNEREGGLCLRSDFPPLDDEPPVDVGVPYTSGDPTSDRCLLDISVDPDPDSICVIPVGGEESTVLVDNLE